MSEGGEIEEREMEEEDRVRGKVMEGEEGRSLEREKKCQREILEKEEEEGKEDEEKQLV